MYFDSLASTSISLGTDGLFFFFYFLLLFASLECSRCMVRLTIRLKPKNLHLQHESDFLDSKLVGTVTVQTQVLGFRSTTLMYP
jgi:hypothetical protein